MTPNFEVFSICRVSVFPLFCGVIPKGLSRPDHRDRKREFAFFEYWIPSRLRPRNLLPGQQIINMCPSLLLPPCYIYIYIHVFIFRNSKKRAIRCLFRKKKERKKERKKEGAGLFHLFSVSRLLPVAQPFTSSTTRPMHHPNVNYLRGEVVPRRRKYHK